MNRLPSLLTVLVLLAPAATADVLQKNRIPAGARWIAHLDVEAMRSSKLYEVIRVESRKDGSNDMDEGLAEIQMFAGLDPTQDFKAITVYCASASEKGCVALLAGNAKIDTALEKMRTLENYHTTPVQSYALHTWGGHGDTWYAYVFRKEDSEERVVVAAQDPDELVRGIAVLERRSESLADAGQPSIRATPAAGSILFAAAGESLNELGEIEPVSAVAKMAKSIVIDLGEDRGALRLHVTLDTRSPEDAQRIQQVLQGAVALVGLVGGEGQEEMRAKLQQLVEALHLSVSNTRVDADFRYDVKALLEDLKSLHELGERDGTSGQRHLKTEKRVHKKQQRQDREDDDDE